MTIEERVDLERQGLPGWWWPRCVFEVAEEDRSVTADYLESHGHAVVAKWLRDGEGWPTQPQLQQASGALEGTGLPAGLAAVLVER